MLGKKTSIAVSAAALLLIGAGSAALAASAAHRSHAATARAAAPVPPAVDRQAHDYVWTQSKEPTYMAIQDQFMRESNSGD